MIAVTSSSLARNSTLPALPNAVECSFLEEMTGADFLLSVAPYPCRTPALLQKHIDAGAILVQHKHSLDLVGSLGERMNESIARMCHVAYRQYQRVLLTVGTFTEHRSGLCINGHDTGIKWVQYAGAMGKWSKRGGVSDNVDRADLIPQWCEIQLRHLSEMRDNPIEYVYNRHPPYMQDDPLQFPIIVKDWRNVAISVPGQGPAVAEWLYRVTGGNWAYAMTLMTHPEYYKTYDDRPKNFGAAQVEKNRTYFGIVDRNYVTQIEYDTVEGEKSDGQEVTASEA